METKKLKKLALNKSVVSKLENVEMNQLKGGDSGQPVESCVPMQCDGGGWGSWDYSQCNCWGY